MFKVRRPCRVEDASIRSPLLTAVRRRNPFSKQRLFHAARVLGPTFLALSFAGIANVAHAQGTMDFSGAQTLMETIVKILALSGGYRRDLDLRIENPPYMALVIEATPEPGPCGVPALSVAHYGEQNSDLMRDPQMCFEISRGFGMGFTLSPFYYRNDYLGVEQYSRSNDGENYAFNPELYAQHESFAALWDKNLRDQGFIEAFARSKKQ